MAMQRSIVDRMRGAALLDVNTYEEVEHDRGATGQAFVVVLIVAVCAAIGGIRGGLSGIIIGPIMAVLGWIAWSYITLFVGTRLFNGTADVGELLRTLGFAQAPGVLAIFGIVPVLGWVAVFVAGIWQLVCGIVAIRQALDFDTGKAVLTALIGWVIITVIGMILGMIFGVGAAVGSMF